MSQNSQLLNDLTATLLAAVQSGGDQWQTRRMLAQRLGKRYLNPVEVLILDLLVEQGAIEIDRQRRYGNGVAKYTTYYHARAIKPQEPSNEPPCTGDTEGLSTTGDAQ